MCVLYVFVYVCICVYVYVCMCVYVYVCVCVDVCVQCVYRNSVKVSISSEEVE